MNKTTYVVIRDMSAGNDSVGEMWKETKVFYGSDTLDDVMNWAMDGNIRYVSRKQITITRPHPSGLDAPLPEE